MFESGQASLDYITLETLHSDGDTTAEAVFAPSQYTWYEEVALYPTKYKTGPKGKIISERIKECLRGYHSNRMPTSAFLMQRGR